MANIDPASPAPVLVTPARIREALATPPSLSDADFHDFLRLAARELDRLRPVPEPHVRPGRGPGDRVASKSLLNAIQAELTAVKAEFANADKARRAELLSPSSRERCSLTSLLPFVDHAFAVAWGTGKQLTPTLESTAETLEEYIRDFVAAQVPQRLPLRGQAREAAEVLLRVPVGSGLSGEEIAILIRATAKHIRNGVRTALLPHGLENSKGGQGDAKGYYFPPETRASLRAHLDKYPDEPSGSMS